MEEELRSLAGINTGFVSYRQDIDALTSERSPKK